MRRKWKYIIAAFIVAAVMFLLMGLKAGIGTQEGKFHFLKCGEDGVSLIFSPE